MPMTTADCFGNATPWKIVVRSFCDKKQSAEEPNIATETYMFVWCYFPCSKIKKKTVKTWYQIPTLPTAHSSKM